MTDELDLLLNNKERQQHEGYIVLRLMDRFDISHTYNQSMYRKNERRFGESFLSLNSKRPTRPSRRRQG